MIPAADHVHVPTTESVNPRKSVKICAAMPPKAQSIRRKKRIFHGNQHCEETKPRKGRKKPKLSTPCNSEKELECSEDGPAHGTLPTSLSVQRSSTTASNRKLGSSNSTVYPRSSSTHSTSRSKVPAYTKTKGVRRKRVSHSALIDNTSSESSDESSNESSNESSSETFMVSFDGSGAFEKLWRRWTLKINLRFLKITD